MRTEAVLALVQDLNEAELEAWVERGWIRPETGEAGWEFLDIDVARVRLVHDLRRQMEVPEDSMQLVLSLLDQVYDLRARLRALLAAVETQPEDIRTLLRAALPPE